MSQRDNLQMFVVNFELDNLTWSIMPAQACIRCPFWSSHIKTLPSSLMVPSGGKFILKFWKAICFRFSGITSDIASEIFLVWKVTVSPSGCSNIGKLFEWKILSLWSCQGGNYKSLWSSAPNLNRTLQRKNTKTWPVSTSSHEIDIRIWLKLYHCKYVWTSLFLLWSQQ